MHLGENRNNNLNDRKMLLHIQLHITVSRYCLAVGIDSMHC